MFESGIENTVVMTAIILWFAQGWYLNSRLADVHKKLDKTLDELNGLRLYLYEIDPQFDDEREAFNDFIEAPPPEESWDYKTAVAGIERTELIKRKKEQGKRTLLTRFSE
jgi:hypothetical protein